MSDSSEKLSNLAMMAMGETVNHLKAENERLLAERATFYMDYRMKCDEETKRLEVELAAVKALLREALEITPFGDKYADYINDRIRAALGDPE